MSTTQMPRNHMSWERALGSAAVWSHAIGWGMALLLFATARPWLLDAYIPHTLLAGFWIGGSVVAGYFSRSVKVAALFIPTAIAPTIELILTFWAIGFSSSTPQ